MKIIRATPEGGAYINTYRRTTSLYKALSKYSALAQALFEGYYDGCGRVYQLQVRNIAFGESYMRWDLT
jgi:hypothetical protein